jgi:hypothetical protein
METSKELAKYASQTIEKLQSIDFFLAQTNRSLKKFRSTLHNLCAMDQKFAFACSAFDDVKLRISAGKFRQ